MKELVRSQWERTFSNYFSILIIGHMQFLAMHLDLCFGGSDLFQQKEKKHFEIPYQDHALLHKDCQY